MTPYIANEAGVYPGWTLAEIKTTGLSKRNGLTFYGNKYSSKYYYF
jgi:hypothetical protein